MRELTGEEGAGAFRLTGPFGASAALHAAVIAAAMLLASRVPAPVARPPVYKVDLIAAPPGPRQVGVVRPPDAPTPTPATPTLPKPAPPTPAPPKVPERPTPAPAVPTKAPPPRTPTRATPVETPAEAAGGARTPPADAPRAGGGPRGDKGTDVATVRTDGIDFPYPGYLRNIVRQIALNFKPPAGSSLSADLAFTIRRDGSVADVRVVRGSGDYEFDLNARGSIEAAARNFGALPEGFSDDALPVVFSFDPQFIR